MFTQYPHDGLQLTTHHRAPARSSLRTTTPSRSRRVNAGSAVPTGRPSGRERMHGRGCDVRDAVEQSRPPERPRQLEHVVAHDVTIGTERGRELVDERAERGDTVERLPHDRRGAIEPVCIRRERTGGRGDHELVVDLDERHVAPRPRHERLVDVVRP